MNTQKIITVIANAGEKAGVKVNGWVSTYLNGAKDVAKIIGLGTVSFVAAFICGLSIKKD